jgi:hypothetical protein
MHESALEERHAYLHSEWFRFLPLWIYVGFTVLAIIAMAFGSVGPSVFLIYIVLAALMGLLIWWLSDIGQVGWAWFVLLVPVIISISTSIVAAGVATGQLSAAAALKYVEKRGMM